MKILFMGTPELAVPFLDVCAKRHSVVGVVTQPDRASGRGLNIQATPVKAAAQRLELKVFQPEKPSLIASELRGLGADMAVVVAYGRILKPDVLSSTRLGFLNVHFSLLPKYRGAAPMQWSLIHGETRSGVTLFWIDEGMDTGPVQAMRETEVGANENVLQLAEKLTRLGTELLAENLEQIGAGEVHRKPQAGAPVLAPRLTREDAAITFEQPAARIHNRVRGLRGGPKAYLVINGSSISVLDTALGPDSGSRAEPAGTILRVESGTGVLIQCSSGSIWVKQVQPEGKRQISAADFVNGLRMRPGNRLVSNGK